MTVSRWVDATFGLVYLGLIALGGLVLGALTGVALVWLLPPSPAVAPVDV